MMTKHLPVKRVNWKITSATCTFSNINYNRTKNYFEPTIPISNSLLYANPLIPFRILNILISILAGILMDGTLKNLTNLLILIQFLILFVFVFKKLVIVHS